MFCGNNPAEGIVSFIYGMIRDMIAEALGMFAQSVAEEVFTLGLATPAVAAQISTWVGEKVAKMLKKVIIRLCR